MKTHTNERQIKIEFSNHHQIFSSDTIFIVMDDNEEINGVLERIKKAIIKGATADN